MNNNTGIDPAPITSCKDLSRRQCLQGIVGLTARLVLTSPVYSYGWRPKLALSCLGLAFLLNDFKRKSVYGVGHAGSIQYADLEPYYAAAEQALGAWGNQDYGSARSKPYPM